MNPLAGRRIKAYGLDMLGYLGVAAATVPMGLVAARVGIGESPVYVVSASAVPVLIAVGIAARAESHRCATWGKRRFGLQVTTVQAEHLNLPSAIGRNLLKIGVPWQLGHVVTISGIYGGFERSQPPLIAALLLVYALIGLGLWGVLRRRGVTFYDQAAASRVTESTERR